MSLDEARFAFGIDASQDITADFFILSDGGYGYIDPASPDVPTADLDTYLLTLDVGSTYTISASCSEAFAALFGRSKAEDVFFAVRDQFGNDIEYSVDHGGYSAVTFTALDSVYYISISSNSGGMYSLSWLNDTVVESNIEEQVIEIDHGYRAEIDFSSDADRFSFSANAGERLYFELVSRVDDLYFDIEATDRSYVANLSETRDGIYGFDPVVSGRYELNLYSDSFVETGEYEFFFTDFLRSQSGIDLIDDNDRKAMLIGTDSVSITGNSQDNTLIGNTGNNTLDGGGGADRLAGGRGNDTYITDGGDTITEGAGEGTDTVRSSVSFVLGANVENLVLTGSGNISGTGNALANTITGNSGANTINGGGGADRLAGGRGNDTYITDGGDTITEGAGEGTDTVRSSVSFVLGANVENLVLTGSGNINGTGNALANTITGNGGRNVLNGALGKDILTGGGGKDVFVFNTTPGGGNVDHVTDFRVVDDTFHLENAVFRGLRGGKLAAGAFVKNTSGNATDRDDRVIYERDAGKLFFDRDGSGSAGKVLVATLDKNLGLTHADFFVI